MRTRRAASCTNEASGKLASGARLACRKPPKMGQNAERDGAGSSIAFGSLSDPCESETLYAFLRRVLGSAVARPR
jgi:hypothetical protein